MTDSEPMSPDAAAKALLAPTPAENYVAMCEQLRMRGLLKDGKTPLESLEQALNERSRFSTHLNEMITAAKHLEVWGDDAWEDHADALKTATPKARAVLEAADEYEWIDEPDVGQDRLAADRADA